MLRKNHKILSIMTAIVLLLGVNGCGNDDDNKDDTPKTNTVKSKTFNIKLSTKNQVKSAVDLSSNKSLGNATLVLDGLKLQYNMTLSGLEGDTISAGHIHTGDALSNGGILIAFSDLSFVDNKTSGTLTLTEEQAKSFTNPSNLYVNLHSSDVPSGLLRGQLETNAEVFNLKISAQKQVSSPVDLSSNKSVGDVTLVLNGLKLQYNMTLSGLEGDTISAGHIHTGDALTNGGVLVAFSELSFVDNKTSGTVTLTEEQAKSFANPSMLYVNLHSSDVPSGLLRGQLK